MAKTFAAMPALLLLAVQEADAISSASRSKANPIRKVVDLLKRMDEKITSEGKKSEQLFDKYMCYCKVTSTQLAASIDAAEDQIPQLVSKYKSAVATHSQLTEDLKGLKQSRIEAKEAVAKAVEIRDKEAADFAEQSANMQANIQAITKGVAALRKGMGGFLQTSAAARLRSLSLNVDMAGDDRDALSAFLATGVQEDAAEGGSGEITGILEQLQETMQKDLATMTSDETESIAGHESLLAAKDKEIKAATKDIEEKTGRVGDVAVEVTTLDNAIKDTEEALAEDKAFSKNLATTCANKKSKWEAYKNIMAGEKLAIADTIKILNDDDALDLFKKTLPSSAAAAASFLQVSRSSAPSHLHRRAAEKLQASRHGDARLDLIQMALKGENGGFDKVSTKIDELLAVLSREQQEDDKKKQFCNSEIDKSEDQQKVDERTIKDREAVIADAADSLATVTDEIQQLMAGIQELDAEAAEQTQLRKEKHEQIVQKLAENNAAISLIEIAKNRLAKFYSPKLYKAPPKRELSQMDRINVNMGGTAPPTPAPGGIAGTGISAASFLQVEQENNALPEAPEAPPSYEKKSEEQGGVLAMLEILRGDLAKEVTQLEIQDSQAQTDYEEFLADSSKKREIDSQVIQDKEADKAGLEETLVQLRGDLRVDQTALMNTVQELASLHKDCDWLLENHDVRKEARESEGDSLKKAKAVLAGADYGR
eukprot:TRINITY_DN4451_c0_g2_i1.p1 TRINITY_DN4451_c0_g2~~TRINITY_DN4451_c0_g2_i1.p1  ORF type:complete len:711 (-),score=326.65 TRINITY_DN4451_c0_g2_i1:225-2357(-)